LQAGEVVFFIGAWPCAGDSAVGYPSRLVCASNPLKMGSLTAVGKPAGNRTDTASSTRGVWVMNC